MPREPRIAAARSARATARERIRTYNFPQGRVTDHRIGLTTHQLYLVLQGEAPLDELIDALITEHQTSQLAAMQEQGHG